LDGRAAICPVTGLAEADQAIDLPEAPGPEIGLVVEAWAAVPRLEVAWVTEEVEGTGLEGRTFRAAAAEIGMLSVAGTGASTVGAPAPAAAEARRAWDLEVAAEASAAVAAGAEVEGGAGESS
jgi:hypothetical protein